MLPGGIYACEREEVMVLLFTQYTTAGCVVIKPLLAMRTHEKRDEAEERTHLFGSVQAPPHASSVHA